MTTKAEALAAIEAVVKAAQVAATVVSGLPDGVPTVPPPQMEDVTITETGSGGLLVTVRAGIDKVRWSLVSNNEVAKYPWYGIVHEDMVPPGGLAIKPEYARDNDFIKVLWGTNYALSKDGPKVTKAVVPTVPATPTGTVTAPQRFVSQLTVGLNQERKNFLGMQYLGTSMTKRDAYDYYGSLGVNFQRFFIPMNVSVDRGLGTGLPSVSSYDDILDAAQAANMAGQFVFFGLTDVLDGGEVDKWETVKTHVDRASKRIAERGFDPTKFVVECANELAQFDNAYWNPRRLELHDIVRKNLPNHIIVHGACGWNGWQGFDTTWAVPADKNIIMQFHHYERRDDWTDVSSKLQAFAKAVGVPMVNGELGDDFEHMDQTADQVRWTWNFEAFARTAGLLRPCPWALIGGQHDFRLNRGPTDARLTAALETSIKKCANTIRTTPGWGV